MCKLILCTLLLWSSLSTGEDVPKYISPNCDHLGVNTLLSMGLEPQFENNQECPCSWKWPEKKAETCIYKGRDYKHGEEFIKKDENSESSCTCNVRKGNQRIICKDTKYTTTWEPSDMSVQCESGNYNYSGNDVFMPDNTCLSCKCKPGFKGEYVEPFCKRYSYDLNFQYQKEISNQCTPYYDTNNEIEKPALCNPSGFICNEDLLEILPLNMTKNSTDGVTKMCKMDDELHFQGTVLNVTFVRYNNVNSVNCTCSTPPLFTCVNNYVNEWMHILPVPYVAPEMEKIIAEEMKEPVFGIL